MADSALMGRLMAGELCEEIAARNAAGQAACAIIPCGPMAWYEPWVQMVNQRRLSLKNLHVYHMDKCLDWPSSNSPPAWALIPVRLPQY